MGKGSGTNYYLLFLTSGVLAATVWSALFPLVGVPAYFLNENQLLYLFSVIAQVIGGLFGLTLTAYVFFIDKIKDSARDDETLYDATTALLSQCFHRLILIATVCGITIFLCLCFNRNTVISRLFGASNHKKILFELSHYAESRPA